MKPNALIRFMKRLWPTFLFHSGWVTKLLMDSSTNSQVDPAAPPNSQVDSVAPPNWQVDSVAPAVSVPDTRKEYVKEACQDLRRRLWLYLLPILIVLAVGWLWIPDDREVITNITVRNVFLYSALLAAFVTFLTIRHFSLKYHIIVRYAFLLRRMNDNEPEKGCGLSSFQMKRWMNRDLRHLAHLLARLPLTIGSRQPDVMLKTARKAAYVQWLQVWVAQPLDDNTFGCLHTELFKSFSTVLDRQWQSLPEREPDPREQITNSQRAAYVLLSVVFAVGAVALIINGKSLETTWPGVSQIGATLLAVGAYLSLGRAGFIPGSLQQALDTAKKVTGE